MVTIMSTEGKPIQVPASSLQMAGVQNSNGKYNKQNNCQRTQELSISFYANLETAQINIKSVNFLPNLKVAL